MAKLGRDVVSALLLGPRADGRLVHESPVRGDVWASYASRPGERIDILIEAHRDVPTGIVASRLARRLYSPMEMPDVAEIGFGISFVEGFVTARLSLCELEHAVLPFTRWSRDLDPERSGDLQATVEREVLIQLQELANPEARLRREVNPGVIRLLPTFRILAALEWAETHSEDDRLPTFEEFARKADFEVIARRAGQLMAQVVSDLPQHWPSSQQDADAEVDSADIFAVSRNRPVETALERSIPAIKADAVSTLFAVSCERIGWAILDTGIDQDHPAFKDQKRNGQTRIAATFDFTRLRKIVLIDHIYNPPLLEQHVEEIVTATGITDRSSIRKDFRTLACDAQQGRSINWSIAERYLLDAAPARPANPHGTHVAGILGGCWAESDYAGHSKPVASRGVCTDIRLYDFRVVSDSQDDTEFAVVGALQFIRYINGRNNYPQIHGANISLSIHHDVRNYACGRTPVCEEAERAVHAGVVVVAAAGNRGFQSFNLSDGGAFETYAPSSITDPGNAEAVITVGSTHRSAPHSYGISFFSSRGPTGDGRNKPDLVAPGEKIWSVVPGDSEDALSGTSMAAPHVSGAAALLMARNPEFIGQATTIKRILCEACTDLGRERNFQGAGMLDILRAMQSI